MHQPQYGVLGKPWMVPGVCKVEETAQPLSKRSNMTSRKPKNWSRCIKSTFRKDNAKLKKRNSSWAEPVPWSQIIVIQHPRIWNVKSCMELPAWRNCREMIQCRESRATSSLVSLDAWSKSYWKTVQELPGQSAESFANKSPRQGSIFPLARII